MGQDLSIPDTRHTEVSFRFSFIFSWPFSKLMPVYFLTSWLNSGTTTRIGLEGPVSSLSRPSARRRGHHVTRHHWYRANPLPTLRMKRYVSFSCSIFFGHLHYKLSFTFTGCIEFRKRVRCLAQCHQHVLAGKKKERRARRIDM